MDANPVLSKAFSKPQSGVGGEVMTVSGAINKSFILLAFVLAPAAWSWAKVAENPTLMGSYIMMGLIGGIVSALVIIFVRSTAPVMAPVYCVCEGVLLGAISLYYEAQFPGIATQAIFLTFGVFSTMLVAYRLKIITYSAKLQAVLTASIGAIMFLYVLTFILSFFGMQMPMIHESGLIGIGFSLFVVAIASLSLIADFHMIETGARQGAPKKMEWFAAWGLMVTLIWLYLELLRLLSKLQSRD